MNQDLLSSLAQVVGEGGILRGDLAKRSCDPLSNVINLAEVIVRPADTRDLAEVVRLCARTNRSIVVHGGLTGVSGGAYTLPDDIVISLEKMNRIERICPRTHTATVQAGVTIQQLREAVEREGLFYPVDLGSRGTATVGGTISTNAGGNSVIRWGMTRSQVLGLEAVTSDGTIINSMSELLKNNTGYDLKQLFIGSEGTLGIVARAVLRLVPLPSSTSTALVSAHNFDAVLHLLDRARRMPSLSAFEVMWREYYDVVTAELGGTPAVSANCAFYVLIETSGYDTTIDEQIFNQFLGQAHVDGLAEEITIAQSDTQRVAIWKIRDSGDIVARAFFPCLNFDVSLPLSDMATYVNQLKEDLTRKFSAARVAVFGHIGDNNIHVAIGTGGPLSSAATAMIEDMVYRPLASIGGSVSAEHGIGSKKKHVLHLSRSPEEINLMRKLRTAVDPDLRLNRQVLF